MEKETNAEGQEQKAMIIKSDYLAEQEIMLLKK